MIRPLVASLALSLAACAPTPPEVAPQPGPPASARAARPAAPALPPYSGAPGSCELDGLSMPLYSARDPRWGSPTAPVAIVLFSDFECPFCGKQRHALDELKVRYGADRLQIIWKNMPLSSHPNARPAADVSEAVFEAGGPDAFWRYHDIVYANRKALSPENLVLWAEKAGVPLDKLRVALEQPSVAAKVNEDMSLARAIGLSATPLLLVNGLPLVGFHEVPELSPVIDEELAAAPKPGPHHACDRMREAWAPAPAR